MWETMLFMIRKNVQAFLRPFGLAESSSKLISKKNQIVDAYIYNWDESLSRDNKISNAQIDFVLLEKSGNDK